MKNKRLNLLMALIVVPSALLVPIVLYIGSKDIQNRRVEKTHSVDSIRHDYRTIQPYLETLEDSIHYFEDGM